jgi:hypothetical protein
MTRPKLSFDDLAVIAVALRIACTDRSLARTDRDRMHRLRLKMDALLRERAPAERQKRHERAQVKERRDARKMPMVSVAEADDWHHVLSGKPKKSPRPPVRIVT